MNVAFDETADRSYEDFRCLNRASFYHCKLNDIPALFRGFFDKYRIYINNKKKGQSFDEDIKRFQPCCICV